MSDSDGFVLVKKKSKGIGSSRAKGTKTIHAGAVETFEASNEEVELIKRYYSSLF